MAAGAPPARAAARDEAHHDVISRGDAPSPARRRCSTTPAPSWPPDEGQRDRQVAGDDVLVGVTEPGSSHPDEHRLGARIAQLDLLDLPGRVASRAGPLRGSSRALPLLETALRRDGTTGGFRRCRSRRGASASRHSGVHRQHRSGDAAGRLAAQEHRSRPRSPPARGAADRDGGDGTPPGPSSRRPPRWRRGPPCGSSRERRRWPSRPRARARRRGSGRARRRRAWRLRSRRAVAGRPIPQRTPPRRSAPSAAPACLNSSGTAARARRQTPVRFTASRASQVASSRSHAFGPPATRRHRRQQRRDRRSGRPPPPPPCRARPGHGRRR